MTEPGAKPFWIRKPAIGLVAVTAGLLGQWLRHAIWPITEVWLGDYQYAALIALGWLGIGLIATNLDKDEITASVAGYAGGLLIWIGWFEFTFHYFAERFAIPPYQASERLVSTPDLNLVQASFPILLTMLFLYGFLNSQTKCNFMRWFHRNLRLNPGTPIKNSPRSIARITAMETLLVIWFCYALWLIITYFSANILVIGVSFLLWAVWFFYIFVQLLKIDRPAYAFRYGIPVGIIGWVLVVTPSHMGMYPVIWLKPFEYPVASIMALAVFVLSLVVVAGSSRKASLS